MTWTITCDLDQSVTDDKAKEQKLLRLVRVKDKHRISFEALRAIRHEGKIKDIPPQRDIQDEINRISKTVPTIDVQCLSVLLKHALKF